MARTAPAPNAFAIPGMNPGIFVLGGGGDGGGGDGGGGNGKGGKQGAKGKNGGKDANGGGKGADACGKGSTSCPGPHGGKGTAAGDPVDCGSGATFTIPHLDLFLPGPLPLEINRQYRSSARDRDVGLGFGWSHTFAWSIEVRRRTLTLWKSTGESAVVAMPEIGGSVTVNDGWLLARTAEGFTLVDDDQVAWIFSEQHREEETYRLSAVADRNGNATSLFYEQGRLAQIVDSVGRAVLVRWGRDGHIASFDVKNAPQQGAWITFYSYGYDDEGDLVTVTDGEGYTTRFTYAEHRMTEEQRPGGLRAVFVHDAAGRCVETWCDLRGGPDPSLDADVPERLADGKTPAMGFLHNKITYGDDGYVEIVTSTQVRRLFTNPFGKIEKGTVGGAVFSHTYDEKGNETSYTDPLGATTRFARDDAGRLIERIDPLGGSTRYEYDLDGELAAVIDAGGSTMRYARDARGNLLAATDALGLVLRMDVDARGLIERIHFANGGVAHIRRDDHGNRVEVVETDGATKRITYDYLGRPVRLLDARGGETRYAYDRRGSLVTMRLPSGGVIRMDYDADGRVCRTTNPEGRVAEYVFGGNGVVIEIIEAGGPTVRARYDREGQLVRLIDEKGDEHVYERDAAGLVVAERTFDGRRIKYKNDEAGRVIEILNGAGEKAELAYDPLGRLLSKVFDDGVAYTYEYDAMGHIERATTPDAVYACAYDARGRRAKETFQIGDQAFTVENTYDEMNMRSERRTSLGHTERIARDIRSRPLELVLDGRDSVRSAWDPAGLEVARRLPGGAIIQSSFDATQLLSRRSVVVGGPAQPAGAPPSAPRLTVDRTYAYNGAGEMTEEHDLLFGLIRYELDPIGQLTARTPQRGLPEKFTYDQAQNLQESAPGSSQRRYERGGRCVLANGITYVHDSDSRLVEKRVPRDGGESDVWRYTWSSSGALRAVTRPDGATIELGYDAFDRRVFKRVREAGTAGAKVTTLFVWDRTLPLHEIRMRAEAEGDPIVEERTYVFSDETREPIGHRDAVRAGDERTVKDWVFYVTNQLDAPEHLVAGNGDVLGSVDLKAFGAVVPAAGERERTPLRFRGQYADDETGLHYNYTRYYDPALAQYISADPILIEGGPRLFAYVGNRPRTFTDPYGLSDPLTTTTTLTNGSTVVGQSQGGHTKAKTTGQFDGGGGTLPSNFPQLPGKNTGPNMCGECESLNKHFDGLDPDNPDHKDEITKRAKEIDKIAPTRDRDGKILPPCEYCSQRIAKLSAVSGVNLFNKVEKPTNGKKAPFTNIVKNADMVKEKTGGKFPYKMEAGPNGTTLIKDANGNPVNAT